MKFPLKSISIPENIPENLHKNFKMLVGIDIACLVIHIYMIFLFHSLGIPFMRRFNYFSVIWFALILLFLFRNKRNNWYCASYGIMTEILIHQSLAVVFIGTDSGFQYFILVAAVCFTYFPETKIYLYIRLGLSFSGIIIFVWLGLYSRTHEPLYAVPQSRLTSLFILCASLAIGIIIIIMYVSYRSNEKAIIELKEKNQQIENAGEAKVNFLANMSHEIRTPMNAILGMTDLILSESISLPVREKTEHIYTASRSLLTIINDILDFSKIESGKMEVIIGEYRLSHMLSDIYFLMAPRAENKALNMSVQVHGEIPDLLIGDEIRIKQVLLNLVSNAVKYTEKGGITIHVSARQTPCGVHLKFSIEDTGMGIRPLDMDKLFSSFTQINTRQNRKIEGTGLGLAISKQLVTIMEGFTNVESSYGKGSVFSFVLPQAVADPAPMVFDSQKSHAIDNIRSQNIRIYNFTAPEAKILLVDDVEMNLKVSEGLLKPYRMQISTAKSGSECLRKLQESKDYDIVFMDHMMPGMDGVDTTKLIREMEDSYYRRLPIVAFTANALTEVKSLLLSSGMNDFITKPIDMNDMHRALLNWLPNEKIISSNNDMPRTENNITWNLPGIHVNLGIAYSGGETRYLEFLGIYCDSAGKILQRLKEALTESNWKQYEINVHALKSTSAGIGATDLSELAKELEKACSQKEYEFILSHTAELEDMVETIVHTIRTALAEQKEEVVIKPGVMLEQLLPGLRRLAASIEDFMPDEALLDSLLLEHCTDYPDYGSILKEVDDALKQFDYETAAARLNLLVSAQKGSESHGEN